MLQLLLALAVAASAPAVKVTDTEALEDDILAVIDLPFAAAEARSAGVDASELKEALEVSRDIGFSAGEAHQIVVEETAASLGKRGRRAGFGQYVRVQLASGLRGAPLAAKIRGRKDERRPISAAESDRLKTRLDTVAAGHRAFRVRAGERRRELVAGGKRPVFVARERHLARMAEVAAAADVVDARLRALDERLAATPDGPDKDALEAERKRLAAEAAELSARQAHIEDRLDGGKPGKRERGPDDTERGPDETKRGPDDTKRGPDDARGRGPGDAKGHGPGDARGHGPGGKHDKRGPEGKTEDPQ